MPPVFTAMEQGYSNLWDAAVINKSKVDAANQIAMKGKQHQTQYAAIEAKTGVPWFVIVPIHMRESSMNFGTHLHNGDSLQGYTHHVPPNRPKVGHGPPFTFPESAADALTMRKLNLVKRWSVERILYEQEGYNGFGYLGKGNSPYLWAWSNEYKSGKYIADHEYSASAVDPQPGCVAMLKALAAIDPTVAARLQDREKTPPKEVIAQQNKNKRATRDTATAAATTGTVAKSTADNSGKSVMASTIEYGMIAAVIAVAVIAAVLVIKQNKATIAKWSGTNV